MSTAIPIEERIELNIVNLLLRSVYVYIRILFWICWLWPLFTLI